jgi:hypothetical protein
MLRALALSVAVAATLTPLRQDTAPRIPVLVELFTSEGCSSCPPADTLLQKLVAEQPIPGATVIALGQHVDYWDRLGWADPFSAPAFTQRQAEYRQRFAAKQIYTPQMVVDGRDQFVGSDAGAARKAIAKAARTPKAKVDVSVEIPGAIEVTVRVAGLRQAGLRQPASLVLAITEDGLSSNVRQGENSGRHLSHAAVVRAMGAARAIEPTADTVDVKLPVQLEASWSRDHVHVVAFVQERESGRVLGAGTAALR